MNENNSGKKFDIKKIFCILKCNSFTYCDLVKCLKYKYELITDPYFKEDSYKNYFSRKNKKIKHQKYEQSKNGLYVHHVAENMFQNLGKEKAIADNPCLSCLPDHGFRYQMPDQLVYCNLVEHALLHLFIMINNPNYYEGYESLNGKIKKWYIDDIGENKLKPNERCFYNASKISKEEAQTLEKEFCEFISRKEQNKTVCHCNYPK